MAIARLAQVNVQPAQAERQRAIHGHTEIGNLAKAIPQTDRHGS
jgi:hypothetical protein